MNELRKLSVDKLIPALCDEVRNDFFLICSPTARVDKNMTDADREVEGNNLTMMKTACVVPGRKTRMNALETTVYGKIYSKGVVSSLEEQGIPLDRNLMFSILCADKELKYLEDGFYYETDADLFKYKMNVDDDEIFLKAVRRLPKGRQLANVNTWIKSGRNRKERDRRIAVAREYKEWNEVTQKYTLLKRVKNKSVRARKRIVRIIKRHK